MKIYNFNCKSSIILTSPHSGKFYPDFYKNNLTSPFDYCRSIEDMFVDEIIYDEPLLELLEKNIEQISFWIIILSGIFVLVAILLINGSIRLSIFSKRLVIKTMQLVGAHKSFIRRPLITNHILMAILSSFFASSGLMLLIFTIDKNIPDLKLLSNQVELFLIFTFVLITGILITFFSSFFAV